MLTLVARNFLSLFLFLYFYASDIPMTSRPAIPPRRQFHVAPRGESRIGDPYCARPFGEVAKHVGITIAAQLPGNYGAF